MNKETIEYYSCIFQNYLMNEGFGYELAVFINVTVNCFIVLMAVTILDIVFRKVIVETFKAFSNKTVSTFDDYLVISNFPKFVAHLIPLTTFWYLIPVIFMESTIVTDILLIATKILFVILSIYIFRSLLRTTRNFMAENEQYKDKPMESYVQVLMIFAWGIGIFLIIQLLTGYSVVSFATLGAASAVLLLIFKDTILGFVASIQVSVNDIVRIGDWITFSTYGADGYVTEINLATVRVQNFDYTYTTIPTYSLIADSFQNWRGMQESQGRRIKRAIYVKQTSIKFLTDEDIEQLKKIQLIKPYLEHRQKEVDTYNKSNAAQKDMLINGKNQTNLGVFRHYADAYLIENPNIHKDLFLMVRHLAPTDKGIPIEIFCFSKDKNWENYEHIQADIFDHLLAALPYFGLEIFELPTGKDITQLKDA